MKKSTKSVAAVALALGVGTLLALGPAGAASAHVGLLENTAEAGSTTLLTFTVPNESDTLTTTQLTIMLPTDTPFASVRPVALAGWDAEVVRETLPEPIEVGETTITEAATSVIWTAADGGFGGESMGLFSLRLGPVPDVDSVTLPALQGYSDGSVVPWEGEEAPVLFINAEPTDTHGSETAEEEHAEETDATGSPDSTTIAALVLGAGGSILGGVALALTLIRRRQKV